MGSTASVLLLGAAIVAVIGTLGVWLALKRPAQALQRRQRDEALAAAAHYTPAERVPAYGPPPDPCAPGLSDTERVEAMRALLLRGDRRAAETEATLAHAPTQPLGLRDAELTTSPMAWNPTLPPDEADALEWQRQQRRARARDSDHEHITV
jgi:hypothetical protein